MEQAQTQHQRLQKRRAESLLWKKGNLQFLLDSNQLGMRDAFYNSDAQLFVFLCSRQIGKTHLTVALANEYALKHPGSRILYVTATTEDAREIVPAQMRTIQETAPVSCRAEHKKQQNKFVFPNGSEIVFMGLDRRPDKPRGRSFHFIIVDEAGFMVQLRKIVDSVLLPTLTTTGGRILFATTPPETADHDFIPILEQAIANESYVKRTIYDCPRFTPKQISEMMAAAGGEDTVAWRRERLCEIVRDKEATVIPEFTEEKAKELVQEVPFPPYCDTYVGFDPGFSDCTGALFGYWDFTNARVVIQDEFLAKRENIAVVAAGLTSKEKQLWGEKKPFRRVGDSADPAILHNLNTLYGISILPVNKTTKEHMVTQLRTLIHNNQLIISPRCKNLISQLLYCRWQGNSRKEFARTAAYAHFDLVDALIYLVISISKNRNPYPQGVGISPATHFIPPSYYENSQNKQLEKLVPEKFRSPRRKIKRFR